MTKITKPIIATTIGYLISYTVVFLYIFITNRDNRYILGGDLIRENLISQSINLIIEGRRSFNEVK